MSIAAPKLPCVAEEWFRSPKWSEDAREDFELRLARARDFNRPQYLRIKAAALADAGGRREAQGARKLLERVIEDYPDSLDVVPAHEQLGELDVRERRLVDATDHFRAALRLSPSRNVYGDARLRLPELLLEAGRPENITEAEAILDSISPGDLVFASQRFRYSVARVRLAQAHSDARGASEHAATALAVAAQETPDFPRHPTIDWVQADKKLLKELRRLSIN